MIFFLALAAALAGIKQEDVHLDRSMSLKNTDFQHKFNIACPCHKNLHKTI